MKNAQASDGGGDDDDDGTEEINGVTVYLNKLTENITEQLLRDIEWSFLQKGWKGQLNESQLCTVLRESADIVVSDQHFQRMFNKMDVRKRRAVDFLQFMVYLSHEFELKRTRHGHGEERLSRLSLRLLPDQPTRGHGRGRRPLEVWGMTFKPELDDLGQAVMDKGEYVAITGKGELVVYTSDLQWTNTYVAQDSAQMTLNSALVAVLALPDFGVVCVSDVIGKLRFYKVSSTEFRLCLIIGRLPSPALCLAYASNGSDGGDARLAYGDQAGGVTVIEFHASRLSHLFRGGSDDGAAPSYAIGHVANRALPRPFGVVRFPQLHPERVADVQFCDDAGLTFASVSLSGSRSMACCRVADRLVRYVAVRDHGIGCVCVAGDTRLATGSVSGTVGVWNVGDFATTTTTTTPGRTPESTPVAAESLIRGSELAGHNAAVWNVFYNRNNGRLYSVALDNVFKVWDVRYEVCLITYDGALCPVDRRRFGATVGHFNQPDQVFTMVTDGGHTFRSVKCGKSANSGGLHAEGRAHFGDDDTHDSECVRTLYNDLYGYLVSVSATDSAIAVWNPRDGELVAKRTMAHYEMIFCETLPVEITAAGFDPSGGLLVTAAANGSVHMWDPNTAVCLNKLQTPSRGRITEVIWLPNKVHKTGVARRGGEGDRR